MMLKNFLFKSFILKKVIITGAATLITTSTVGTTAIMIADHYTESSREEDSQIRIASEPTSADVQSAVMSAEPESPASALDNDALSDASESGIEAITPSETRAALNDLVSEAAPPAKTAAVSMTADTAAAKNAQTGQQTMAGAAVQVPDQAAVPAGASGNGTGEFTPSETGAALTDPVPAAASPVKTTDVPMSADTAAAKNVQTSQTAAGAAPENVQSTQPTAGAVTENIQTSQPTAEPAAEHVQTSQPTAEPAAEHVQTSQPTTEPAAGGESSSPAEPAPVPDAADSSSQRHTTSIYTDDESTLLRVEYYDDDNHLYEYSRVSDYDKETHSYTETIYQYDNENQQEIVVRTDTYVNGELTSSENP